MPSARFRCCCLSFLAALSLRAEPPPSVPSVEAPDAARREAWVLAGLMVARLEEDAPGAGSGTRAWLEDFQRAAVGLEANDTSRPFPFPDTEALVTHNPRFWAAAYEIQPGDPALALLHAALLLSGGEAQRASQVAIFGRARRGQPEEFRAALARIGTLAETAQRYSCDLVRVGVARCDAGDFAGALTAYGLALREWRANGWAWYERGLALRRQALAGSGRPLRYEGAGAGLERDPPEAGAAFAEARRHDPLLVMAYQGDAPEMLPAFMSLLQDGWPAWEAMRKHPDEPVLDSALERLAESCRRAAIDDYALALRQQSFARGHRATPEDALFIAECLRRLAPGEWTETTLARWANDPPLPPRCVVAIATEQELALAEKAKKEVVAQAARAKTPKAKKRTADSEDPPLNKPRKKRRKSSLSHRPEAAREAADGVDLEREKIRRRHRGVAHFFGEWKEREVPQAGG